MIVTRDREAGNIIENFATKKAASSRENGKRMGGPVIIALAMAAHRTTTENGIAPVMSAHRADVLWAMTGTGTSTEIKLPATLILANHRPGPQTMELAVYKRKYFRR